MDLDAEAGRSHQNRTFGGTRSQSCLGSERRQALSFLHSRLGSASRHLGGANLLRRRSRECLAGSNQEDYIVHGYAESIDGRSNWSKHKIVFPAEEKVFDFCVIPGQRGYEAVFSRVWLDQGLPPAATGLWWCHAKTPSSDMSDWSTPVQIMTAEDRGWRSGPWKPSVQYSETNPNQMFVFFDGIYRKDEAGPFPFVFTLGCLEIDRPQV
jgi:hypothetical protein